jgi:glycine/D-amino acid oxidase-like deaminating enzyme
VSATTHTDVLIIGGGGTGLAAAIEAAARIAALEAGLAADKEAHARSVSLMERRNGADRETLRVLLLIQRVPALRLVVQSMVSALPRAKESMVVLMVLRLILATD